ncbi:MAG TPA: rRNA adenine N-6-methyltransferase family protein, partial [Gammaproteobacteria bacterium]|nr:rRNA adenine N-6-methyltransferase family protein [Gammaproteobacteria bacterium]
MIIQHNIRKRFGQNFLVDNNIINKILDLIEPRKHDHFIEIGPGMGALTFPILDRI